MLTQRCLRAHIHRYANRKATSPLTASSRNYAFNSSRLNDARQTAHATPTAQLTFSKRSTARIQRIPRSLNLGITRMAMYTTEANEPGHTAVKDDSHPSLFYHLFDDDELLHPVFALSFIERRPMTARSKVVLGWLPALALSGSEDGGNGLNDFKQNEEFLPVLHKTIQENLLQDEIWTNGAIQAQSGWMHIFDQRKIPPLGRIADPDDILASVRVEEGQMLMDTYEPMPSYRLCTADGVCQLTETLLDRLKVTLEKIAEDEMRHQ